MYVCMYVCIRVMVFSHMMATPAPALPRQFYATPTPTPAPAPASSKPFGLGLGRDKLSIMHSHFFVIHI